MPASELYNLVYSIIAKDDTRQGTASAQANLRGVGTAATTAATQVESFATRARNASVAVGGAMVALAGAVSLLTAGARQLNSDFAMVALSMNSTTGAVRDAAVAVSDYSFRLSEVSPTFDTLARAGVTTEEQLKRVAVSMDNVGDSTGKTANQIATIGVQAFNAFGLEIEQFPEYEDKFTAMFRRGNVAMDEFSTVSKRVGPALSEIGVSLDDLMAILMVFEDRGITGR